MEMVRIPLIHPAFYREALKAAEVEGIKILNGDGMKLSTELPTEETINRLVNGIALLYAKLIVETTRGGHDAVEG